MKKTMLCIVFSVSLCRLQGSLSAMELTLELQTKDMSNSSSEICFFITNIAQQNNLPKDVKNIILMNYIMATDDERIKSQHYEMFIDMSSYMSLNKKNKYYIQRIFDENATLFAKIPRFDKELRLTSYPEARVHYQALLQLPKDVRRNIAKRYSSQIFVKQKNKIDSNKNEIENFVLGAYTIMTPLIVLVSSFIIDHITEEFFNFSGMFPITIPLSLFIGFLIGKTESHTYPKNEIEVHEFNGYKMLPLVPEDDEKQTGEICIISFLQHYYS